jgi:hypothetical protein
MKFILKNVAEKEARDELVAKHGRMATPTLILGGRVFLGFRQNRDEIERIVNELVRTGPR